MNARLIGAAILACTSMMPVAASAQVSIGISVRLAPPLLPVYAQPPLPGPDYLWTPGYWAWDDYADAYYWVPGTWVRAPRPGLLWTPPWWGWGNGAYIFHSGYWGPHIGFYGGVAYGFGYTGFGYQGGYWNGGHLFYNRTVNNITNVHVTNVYQTNVTNTYINHVSYNGGPGGVRAQPRPEEQQAARDQHVAPTSYQQDHVQGARSDPQAFASANRGHPPIAATPRPLSAQSNRATVPGANPPSARGEPGGQPGQPRQHGLTAGDEHAMAGPPPTPQGYEQRPDRFVGEPDRAGDDPRHGARGPAAPDRHAQYGGEHFAPPPHASQPRGPQPQHQSKPPHMPKPPGQHPQGHHDHHHDDHHHD